MRAQHPEVPLLVRGIEQERERHLEHVGDLDRIGRQRERRLDPADDRRDPVSGHGLVLGAGARERIPARTGARPPRSLRATPPRRCDASSGSTRPPGKLICPGWSGRSALRCVSSTCSPCGRLTSGTRTAAGVAVPSRPGQPESIRQVARRRRGRTRERLRQPVALGERVGGGTGEAASQRRGRTGKPPRALYRARSERFRVRACRR